jgi:hypothetical protein
VVWLPTVHATAHIETMGHAFDPRWSGCCSHGHAAGDHDEVVREPPVHAFDERLQPRRDLLDVLESVAEVGATLATGHLSAAEVEQLVPLCLEAGIRRVILTHPHYPCVGLDDEALRRLARHPEVFIEHCFAIHTIEDVPLHRFVDAIRATGPEQVLLSTDFGQVHSDPFPEGTQRYAHELWSRLQGSITEDAFVAMFTANGARALGL